jgi:hypothetical protein
MGIQLPDEDYIKEAIDEAEDQLLRRAGYCFLLEIAHADEASLVISAVRNDGARAEYRVAIPDDVAPEKLNASQQVRRDRLWFRSELGAIVKSLCMGIVEDESEPEPEPAAQPEPEQRFAVVISFGSRPDVVLTPERGVPADEAVRVYAAFLAGAAAIGGHPAMLPLGA